MLEYCSSEEIGLTFEDVTASSTPPPLLDFSVHWIRTINLFLGVALILTDPSGIHWTGVTSLVCGRYSCCDRDGLMTNFIIIMRSVIWLPSHPAS